MNKVEFRGKTKTIREWAEELNISYATLYQRLFVKKMDIEKALTKGMPKTKIDNNKKRVVVIGDVHVPYHLPNLIDEIVKLGKVDYIVIGGDLVDCESCSSYLKIERMTLEEELIEAHKFITELIERTGATIYCNEGNHEERLEKEVSKMHQKGIQRMIDPQLLRMLKDGFTFYKNEKKESYPAIEKFNYINKWYMRLFDNMITCHPKNFSNVPGRVAEQSAEHFLNKGVIEKDDIVFVQHTHKFSNIIASRRQDVFVTENGCCCKSMDYADSGILSYGTQVNMMSLVEFEEGKKINKNDVKHIFL